MAVASSQIQDMIPLRKAAQMLQVHPETVRQYAKKGRIRAWQVGGVGSGGNWLVSEHDVRSLLEPVGPRRDPLPQTRAELDREAEEACAELRKLGYDV